MFIQVIDDGLERMLRAGLPLPPELGDVTFEAPTAGWSAQLSRVTVNLFLYDVARSSQPGRSAVHRLDADGRLQQRAPLPLIQLSYLVSAWAGSPRDEHQLLGDVVSLLAAQTTLGPEHLPVELPTSVDLAVGEDRNNRAREVWTAAGGQLKASVSLQVVVPADSFGWTDAAPSVDRIALLTAPVPASRAWTTGGSSTTMSAFSGISAASGHQGVPDIPAG